MKKQKLLFALALGLFSLLGCEKNDDEITPTIEGIYEGTLELKSELKSYSNNGHEGTAIVTKLNDKEIQVHCFGGNLDTTFMLNYFEDNDSVFVCLTGEAFQHRYGHRQGEGHMNGGGMMHQNNQTQWGQHINNEHNQGDEHYGGFHMESNSFNCVIDSGHGYYHFEGEKQ